MCINFNYCIQRSWSMFVQKQLLVHVLYINIYASSTCMLLYREREYIGIIGQHWTQAIIGYVDKFTNWTFLTYSEKHKSSGKHQVILFLLGDAILYLVYYWQVAQKHAQWNWITYTVLDYYIFILYAGRINIQVQLNCCKEATLLFSKLHFYTPMSILFIQH